MTFRPIVKLALVVALAGAMLLVASSPSLASRPTARSASSSGFTCPKGDACSTIPAKCPVHTTCPTVEAGPVNDLGVGQYTFVNLKNFNPGDEILIAYCQDTVPLAKAAPLCDDAGTATLENPTVGVPIFADGQSSYSYSVAEDTDDGNAPFQGEVPGTGTKGVFFCDNGPNYCAIVVTDSDLNRSQIPSPQNSTELRVSFQALGTGCPRAKTIDTMSDFGIESALVTAAELNCSGKHPTVASNTALDSDAAIESLNAGFVPLAFTDDPDSSSEARIIHSPTRHIDLIPVAVTANVIGTRATMLSGLHGYPLNDIELTPNMVAGFVTAKYGYLQATDLTKCVPGFPPSNGTCSLFWMLNTPTGFIAPQAFGAYVRSDTTGSTQEMFQWICQAPKVPVDVDTYNVSEVETGSQVLEAGLGTDGKPLRTCPQGDQFPSLNIAGTFWAAVNDPSQQQVKLTGFVLPPSDATTAQAGFAPMIWSEALYYGLYPAALQNAAGHFEYPTAASIYQALAIEKQSHDGTSSPVYDDAKAKGAYPMPVVIYAAFSTTHQPKAQQARIETLLGDLLKVTGGSEISSLPPGFVPLPATMYKHSEAELASAFAPTKPHGSSTGPQTSTTTTLPETTVPPVATTPVISPTGSGPPSHKSGASKVVDTHHTSPNKRTPVSSGLLSFAVVAPGSGALSLILVLGIGALIAGLALLLLLRRGRSRRTAAAKGA